LININIDSLINNEVLASQVEAPRAQDINDDFEELFDLPELRFNSQRRQRLFRPPTPSNNRREQ